MKYWTGFACTFAVLAIAGTAHAQNYPAHDIKMIVPFPAGGPSDTVARIVAEMSAHALGHDARDRVAGPSGRERHNHLDVVSRIILRVCSARNRQHSESAREPCPVFHRILHSVFRFIFNFPNQIYSAACVASRRSLSRIAISTFSGVAGRSVMRTPTAS